MSANKRSLMPAAPAGPESSKPALPERVPFKVLVRPRKDGHPLVGVEFATLKDLSEWEREQFEGEVVRLAGVAARLVTRALSGRKSEDVPGDALLGTLKRFVAAISLALDAQPVSGAEGAPAAQRSVSDDTFIDQRSGLIPKEVFLRLHREGAFATKKVGKRILARWGDVRRALEGSVKERKPTKAASGADDIDELRRELGLEPKDGG